jgi:hypothetical protein
VREGCFGLELLWWDFKGGGVNKGIIIGRGLFAEGRRGLEFNEALPIREGLRGLVMFGMSFCHGAGLVALR